MEKEDLTNQTPTTIIINDKNMEDLLTTSKWAMFLAILGFIALGFMALIGIFFLIFGSIITNNLAETDNFTKIPFGSISIIYLFFSILYFIPNYYLYQFAKRTKNAIQYGDQQQMDAALKFQKKMYLFIGILTICVIASYVLILPIFIFFNVIPG